MKLKYVTLTGADENTSLSDLKELSREFPFVEWAFLLSNDGKSDRPRYPSLGWIANTISELNGSHIAIHLCGSVVPEYLYQINYFKWLWNLVDPNNIRIQLNFPKYLDLNSDYLFGNLHRLLWDHPYVNFIIQHSETNSSSISKIINDHMFIQITNLQLLRDCSGGHGVREDHWEIPSEVPSLVFYGFAGGIGPDSVDSDLTILEPLLGDKLTWIDMESKIRKNIVIHKGHKSIETSILDIVACRKILEIAQQYT